MKSDTNLSFLMKKSGSQKLKIFISIFFSVVSSALMLMPYILVFSIISELGNVNPDYSTLTTLVTWTAIAAALQIVTMVLSLGFSHWAAFSVLYEIRIKAAEHMGRLNLGFFRKNAMGKIKKNLDEDIEKLELFIAHQIPDFVQSIIIPLGIIIYLFIIKWWMALLLLGVFLLAISPQILIFKDYNKNMGEYNENVNKLHGTIVQYIYGMNVFKAFSLTANKFKIYRQVIDEYLKMWIRMCDESIVKVALSLTIINSGGLFVAVLAGGIAYLKGGLGFSGLVMYLILGTVFLTAIVRILNLGGTLAMLLKGAENVRAIMEEKPQVSRGEKVLESLKGGIRFDHVSFAYEKEDVLHEVSLEIEPNSMVALVGPSGSGKTTMGMLIGRFWDVEEGSISIDGVNIKDLSLSHLMEITSFVFQDIFMLNDTVLNNVKMSMDRTKEEVIQACKEAQIHDFIMTMEKGYDTLLGEGSGIKLSGGEMQRISIARAILKNSKIIVLDEVTSYSDIDNEKNIQRALKNLLKNKTAVIIAHRLYTIKNAHKIVVLDEGRIVEEGRHEELLALGGMYHGMWTMGREEVSHG